jgi:hemerythrin-like metal-binding protein
MDNQHAILMDTMNELRLALAHGAKRAETDQLLNKVIEFTRMHFRSEEQMLERYDFPALAEHRAEHLRLLAELEDAVSREQLGGAMTTNDLLCFLHDWFIGHVEGVDQKYGQWLNARNVN